MKRTLKDTGYEALANAIICQALSDYKASKNPKSKLDRKEIEDFFAGDWYKTLTSIESSYLLEKIAN